MKIVAIILTKNETKHIRRCIESVAQITRDILIVDSFSTDDTVGIAEALGARVLVHPFNNHASQFNWALQQVERNTDWIIRIDADEYLTPELADTARNQLGALSNDIAGVYINRWMTFQGRRIRWGGVFPIQVLRFFRYGCGQSESRWMDEHIVVNGATARFPGGVIDDNHHSLSWWTDKHNGYSSREVVDLLNLKYQFMPGDAAASLPIDSQAGLKRWIKEKVYSRLPSGWRALSYFFYRYVIRAGFLDGKPGLAFHVLQGFWYRFLVDAKLNEVERYMEEQHTDAVSAIEQVLGIHVRGG